MNCFTAFLLGIAVVSVPALVILVVWLFHYEARPVIESASDRVSSAPIKGSAGSASDAGNMEQLTLRFGE